MIALFFKISFIHIHWKKKIGMHNTKILVNIQKALGITIRRKSWGNEDKEKAEGKEYIMSLMWTTSQPDPLRIEFMPRVLQAGHRIYKARYKLKICGHVQKLGKTLFPFSAVSLSTCHSVVILCFVFYLLFTISISSRNSIISSTISSTIYTPLGSGILTEQWRPHRHLHNSARWHGPAPRLLLGWGAVEATGQAGWVVWGAHSREPVLGRWGDRGRQNHIWAGALTPQVMLCCSISLHLKDKIKNKIKNFQSVFKRHLGGTVQPLVSAQVGISRS